MERPDVADITGDGSRISRRMWLGGLGGGLLSVPFLRWFDVPPRSGRAPDVPGAEAPCCAYVDSDGWMLTPDDVAALEARRNAK